MSERIDIVYTWVDGNEPSYLRLRNEWALRCGARTSPERDRDDLQLLRYSLRSLEKYAPWHGRIFLVTARPQKPGWLKLDPPDGGLTLVHHDEIFADKEALPTFNSFAIEHNLHRVPGLSRHFLYINDDHLFGCPVKPQHFLEADGTVRLYLERDVTPDGAAPDVTDAYGRIVQNTNRYLDHLCGARTGRRHMRHGPLLLDRDRFDESSPEVLASVRNRFRHPSDIAMDHAYCHRRLVQKADKTRLSSLATIYLRTFFQRLTNDLEEQRRKLRLIRLLRPRFYCLNDDLGDTPDPRVMTLLRSFLEQQYPEKSRFEL